MAAVRPEMGDLIARVRGLIHDPPGPAAVFADTQVQDRLDRTRVVERLTAATVRPTISASAGVEWLEYAVDAGDWSGDVLLQNLSFADITTDAVIDYQTGRATFTTSHLPPVYWSGETYDVYAAAAALTEEWAADLADTAYDVTDGDQHFKFSQRALGKERQAARLRLQARVTSLGAGRGDTRP